VMGLSFLKSLYIILNDEFYILNVCCFFLFFSPDCSENPFYFFFKNKKIVTKSGISS